MAISESALMAPVAMSIDMRSMQCPCVMERSQTMLIGEQAKMVIKVTVR